MQVNTIEGDRLVHQVVADWRGAPLSLQDRALCAYATKLSRKIEPTSEGDLDELRAVGLDDVAIHDATQVIGYFNYITRIADGLGVEPEVFIRPWGDPSTDKPTADE